MKLHPTAVEGSRDLRDRKGIQEFVDQLVMRVGADRDGMQSWLDRKAELYNRRFGRYGRDVSFPWPGAADVVIPLEDIHVEEFKPPLMSLSLGGPRVYTMLPQNADAIPYALNASRVMQSLHMGHGANSMPDYVLQTAWSIESLGQHGLAIDKTFYDYQTRQTTEAIRKSDMPSSLANFVVDPNPTQQEVAFAQSIGITMISREQFDAQAKVIRQLVEREYGMDPEDPIDKVAVTDIMRFLRNGSPDAKIMVKRRAVIRDCPHTINVPIEDIIVPAGTILIDNAERITHRLYYSESDLRQKARDEVWDSSAVETALGGADHTSGSSKGGRSSSSEDPLYQDRTARQYINTVATGADTTEMFEVWECYDTWDIDGDGLDERVVLTVEPNSGAILKAIELPFDNGEWPFTCTFFEATDQSYFGSRGIPEKIDDMARHATALARAELNGLILQTSQTFTYLIDGGINPQTMPWMPGLMIPVHRHDALQPVQMTPTALALEGPMRNMMGIAERIVSGSNRAALDNPPPERRTAAEIGYFDNASKRILGVRGLLWNHGMARKGQLAWDLFKQYGPDSWWTYLTGQPPVKMTQAQIRGEFLAVPAGAVADMDPEYRKQQALMLLQLTQGMSQQYGDDPRYVFDTAQAFVNLLDEYSPVQSQVLVHRRSPEEIQQLVQGRQQQAAQMQQMAQAAEQMLANAPTNIEDARRVVEAIQRESPHKELQNLIVQGQQAQRNVERDAALIGAPNGHG